MFFGYEKDIDIIITSLVLILIVMEDVLWESQFDSR